MIGRFGENIFILNKNFDIKDCFKNQYYEIKGEKIVLFSSAFALINGKTTILKPNTYYIKNIKKLLFADSINEEFFCKQFIYEGEKFIYIHFYNIKYQKCEEFKTKFEDVKKAEEFLEKFLDNEFKNIKKESMLLIFNELFFNSYEHGNLGLTFEKKEQLFKENRYIEYLKKAKSDKSINVCIGKINYKNNQYLVCKITDEGNGFDLNQNKTALYNGRGLLMSSKISKGVFYNEKGNSVIFIKEIK